MDAYRAVVDKRDTRSFTAVPVREESLRRVLQGGRMAGSAKNLQPCRFVVLADQAAKEKLAACGQFSSWIPNAPVNIAVLIPADGRDFDAGRAAQNMMVVAQAEGLASCPVTMHDNDAARRSLNAPEGWRVAIVLAVGHPAESQGPRLQGVRLPLDELVHWEGWRRQKGEPA